MTHVSYNALRVRSRREAPAALQLLGIAGRSFTRRTPIVNAPWLCDDPRNAFLFMGESGTGKTFAVDALVERFPTLVHRAVKLLSRPRRPSDDGTRGLVVGVPRPVIRLFSALGLWYSYAYGGRAYALSKRDLASPCPNIATVVGSTRVIREVRRDFPRDHVIAVYLTAPRDRILARLHAAGCTAAEVRTRLARSAEITAQYAADPGVFDHVITNDGSREAFEDQLVELFCSYNPGLLAPPPVVAAAA